MIEFASVGSGDARDLLRAVKRTGQRFLGTDPVTDTAALMQRRLEERHVRLLAVRRDGKLLAVAGYVPGAHNPRQADVELLTLGSVEAAELVPPLLTFLGRYERITSFVKVMEYGDTREAAFRACGFREVGRLRRHSYARGEYHDLVVLHGTWSEGVR